MLIAIPKEVLPEEKRVAATPETVKKYIALGFTVAVEKGAGEGVFITDDDYKNVGATITEDVEKMLDDADVVLKVKQPVFNEQKKKHEVEMLRKDSILITFLHPAAPGNHEMIRNLQKKNITALTMDGIPRISRAQRMDALSSMSAVTGYKAVIMVLYRNGIVDTGTVVVSLLVGAIGLRLYKMSMFDVADIGMPKMLYNVRRRLVCAVECACKNKQ